MKLIRFFVLLVINLNGLFITLVPLLLAFGAMPVPLVSIDAFLVYVLASLVFSAILAMITF